MNEANNIQNTTEQAVNYTVLLCGVIVEWNRTHSGIKYRGMDKCGLPVKWKITYKAVSGKMKTELVCGRHYVQAKKNHEKLKTKHNYNNLFEAEEYNAT